MTCLRDSVRIRYVVFDKTNITGFVEKPSRLTCQHAGTCRRAMIAPVLGKYLVFPGVLSGYLYSVFIGLGSGVGEEHLCAIGESRGFYDGFGRVRFASQRKGWSDE